MTVEIISWSFSTEVWDRPRIKLVTPGSAVSHTSVARHLRATQPIQDEVRHNATFHQGLSALFDKIKSITREKKLLENYNM